MNLDKILEYQNLDSQLYKIEKQVRDSESKKTAAQMHENMKNAQERSLKLEEKAGAILAEIEKVKQQYKIQESKMNEFLGKDISNLSKAELEKYNVLKDKLSQNLSILDKNLSSLAETINGILADFNKTIKTFNTSKDEYFKNKEKYENEVKSVEKDKQDVSDRLKSLEKNIEPKVMEDYKRKRKENIFPVFVPLSGDCCGYCHVQLPFALISSVENNGVFTCEHCHRIIYKK